MKTPGPFTLLYMIKTQGFTLQEMVIVVVVMGLLASLALPRLMRVREATILSEGIQVLQPLRSAQERRILEGNAYTADCNDLDITVGTLANFNAPNCFNDGRVSIQRKLRN